MKDIVSIDQLDMDKLYTYADYFSWKLDERLELIKGKIFEMSPVPSNSHQRVSFELSDLFYNFF